MLSHEALMGSYEDVNKEIQDFLARKPAEANNHCKKITNDIPDILPTLESLCSIYNEINYYLKTQDSEALKDVILKSDIKMNLVCETLLQTLKRTTELKNKLYEENKNLEKNNQDFIEQDSKNKMKISKLESDLEYKNSNLNELNRVIMDQKEKINDHKEENIKLSRDINLLKIKIDEIENLRKKSHDKMEIYEKEIEAINKIIQERDDSIRNLIAEKKEEMNKNGNVKTRLIELERSNEILNKKLESKERSLNLCNTELSKLLNELKTLKSDHEKYKADSIYYQSLYENLNKQNAYLNKELNKILKEGEYNKDREAFVKKYTKKFKKYKNKLKKYENENSFLKKELEGLKSNETMITDSSDNLIKRIDELTNKNKEYRTKIRFLEDRKTEIESKLLKLEKESKQNFNKQEYFKAEKEYQKQFNHLEKTADSLNNRPKSFDYKKYEYLNKPSIKYDREYALNNDKNVLQDYRSEIPSYQFKSNYDSKPFNELFSTPSFINPIMQELRRDNKEHSRLFNLANEYNVEKPSDLPGGFIKSNMTLEHDYNLNAGLQEVMKTKELENQLKAINIEKESKEKYLGDKLKRDESTFFNNNLANNNLDHNFKSAYSNDEHQRTSVKNEINRQALNAANEDAKKTKSLRNADLLKKELRKYEDEKTNALSEYKNAGSKNLNDDTLRRYNSPKPYSFNNQMQLPEDEPSTDTVKTYHTTSSLREMISRTDNLQKKFENLEEQLANIKEGNTEENLREKIKTYNNNVDPWDIDLNDSDFL